MEQYQDMYLREEKNPAKRRSAWDIFLTILLPIIVGALILLLCLQFYWLSGVSADAKAPDGIATIGDDLPDVNLVGDE